MVNSGLGRGSSACCDQLYTAYIFVPHACLKWKMVSTLMSCDIDHMMSCDIDHVTKSIKLSLHFSPVGSKVVVKHYA